MFGGELEVLINSWAGSREIDGENNFIMASPTGPQINGFTAYQKSLYSLSLYRGSMFNMEEEEQVEEWDGKVPSSSSSPSGGTSPSQLQSVQLRKNVTLFFLFLMAEFLFCQWDEQVFFFLRIAIILSDPYTSVSPYCLARAIQPGHWVRLWRRCSSLLTLHQRPSVTAICRGPI